MINTPERLTTMINYPKIILFPGHSPELQGAAGSNLREHGLAVGLCYLIEELLKQSNIPVEFNIVHGKTVIEYIENRINIIKEIYAHDQNLLGIEVHFDCSTNIEAKGGHIIYFPGDEKAKRLAVLIQKRLVKIFPGRSEQVVERRDLGWLARSPCPSILIEVCFISHSPDIHNFLRKRTVVADKIVAGIIEYIKEKNE